MGLTLSLNTNPLVNRFAEPGELIETVARDLRLRDLQLTHEFINPSWPAPVIRRLTREMSAAMARGSEEGWVGAERRQAGWAVGLTLSLNTNPLVNRFAEPGELIETVARDLRLRDR